jgi:hypothetical protein
MNEFIARKKAQERAMQQQIEERERMGFVSLVHLVF